MSRDIHETLRELDGQTLPGGCDACDATQEIRRDALIAGIFHLDVQHDDDCPRYRRLKRQGLAQ